jgi:hypothetical protein
MFAPGWLIKGVMDVGESWAYRANRPDNLVEVHVLRIGTSKAARCKFASSLTSSKAAMSGYRPRV